MAEYEGEIEYLEEDTEIVQQCVQSVQLIPTAFYESPNIENPSSPLLVERKKVQKRKRVEEDDSEYDPSEDDVPPSPPSPPMRKRRAVRPAKPKIKSNEATPNIPYSKSNIQAIEPPLSAKELFTNRKKYNIRIPDFDDPLCLPVRALKVEQSDQKRLNNWNNACLEHFKHCDTLLKPEQGNAKKSVRTAVFKNVINKQTGNDETTIWSKTCVENEDGDKKSEIFQCILPRYKEKKFVRNYSILRQKSYQSIQTVHEVILSKEDHKDGEALVVYKPKDSMSAVYGLIDKRKKQDDAEVAEQAPPSRNEDSKLYLQELAVCKVCAPCFQASWRGVRKHIQKSLLCPICARSYVTIYNLLSHFKSHSPTDVHRYKKIISQILADIVGYHYKCRVCRKKLPTIKALREHVLLHQSKEKFTCEVCNVEVNKNK